MREQILKLRSEGFTLRKISETLGVSKSTVEYHINPAQAKKRQSRVRRNNKRRLVEFAGGKCVICGYNKSISALDFHHKNPEEKLFGIAVGSKLKFSYQKLLEETKKCVLVCSNCHHEIHDGIISI